MSQSLSEADRLSEYDRVRAALDAAGLPWADFGVFTTNRYPEIFPPSTFDDRRSVSVLLEILPTLRHPDVVESVVRHLSTKFGRPIAAGPLIALFKRVDSAKEPSLKWAIGNALGVVTTPAHKEELLKLILDREHGHGRQMIVERVGRISGDPRIVDALRNLAIDPDVALHAQAGLRRRLGHQEALAFIRPLLSHASESVRKGAAYNLKRAEQAARRRRKRIQSSTSNTLL